MQFFKKTYLLYFRKSKVAAKPKKEKLSKKAAATLTAKVSPNSVVNKSEKNGEPSEKKSKHNEEAENGKENRESGKEIITESGESSNEKIKIYKNGEKTGDSTENKIKENEESSETTTKKSEKAEKTIKSVFGIFIYHNNTYLIQFCIVGSNLSLKDDSNQNSDSYNPSVKKYHPIKNATWIKDQKVPYAALTRTLEEIENVSARLKIVEILSNYFRSVIVLSPEDLLPSVYLCLNKLGPAYEGL